MKQYQKTLVILNEKAKPDSKHNKLVKIMIETEEEEFKEILKNLIKAYSLYIKPSWCRDIKKEDRTKWTPVNNSEWRTLVSEVKEEAIQFLESRITNNKPQWQIIAEKNGWAPK